MNGALAYFDSLPAAPLATCFGRWRGSSYDSGHPLDGVLESYGWWGKEFEDAENVHPLVFGALGGGTMHVNPAPLPIGLLARHPSWFRGPLMSLAFRALRPLLRTSEPRARLRLIEHRGVATTAMIHDDQPIIDVFRKIDDDKLLGMMDLRTMAQPFFFKLERAGVGA